MCYNSAPGAFPSLVFFFDAFLFLSLSAFPALQETHTIPFASNILPRIQDMYPHASVLTPAPVCVSRTAGYTLFFDFLLLLSFRSALCTRVTYLANVPFPLPISGASRTHTHHYEIVVMVTQWCPNPPPLSTIPSPLSFPNLRLLVVASCYRYKLQGSQRQKSKSN